MSHARSAHNRVPGLYAGARRRASRHSQALENPATGRALIILGLSAATLLAVLLLREPVKRAARVVKKAEPGLPPTSAEPAQALPRGQATGTLNLATMWPHLPESDRSFLATITPSQLWDPGVITKMNPDTASVKTARSIANTAEQFVRLVKEPAIRSARKNGYPFPQFLVAQSALESGWGKKAIGGTNLWGHAATPDWSKTRKYSLEKTREYRDGKEIQVYRPFRVYDNLEQGFDHHVKVLDRFPGAKKATTPRAFAEALVIKDKKGKVTRYATDPQYPSRIDSVYGTVSRLW